MLHRYEPLKWLKSQNHKAYLIGNQVRAILLGQEESCTDIDIASDVSLTAALTILRKKKIIPSFTDSKFGVVSFVWGGLDYSITTFREDIYSEKELARFKRYPSKIKFVKSIQKDAERRDVTINAIYFDPSSGRYFDPLGGLKDWKNKIIRVVGKPSRRFEEDPLRILRTVRFKNLLGFHYQAETWKALKEKGYLVRTLADSIRSKELRKIQDSPHAQEALKDLREFGVITA
jgi:tRNA nucleotidyltransferase (CCA-adding enzyme)